MNEKTKKSTSIEVLEPLNRDDFVLTDIDKKIIQLMTDYPKITQNEIAQVLGIHFTTISKLVNRPVFQRALADMTKTFLEVLTDAQTMSARRLRKLINDPDKHVALSAIKLAMAPYVNSGTLRLKSEGSVSVEHIIQMGENGQVIRESRDINSSQMPTVKEVMDAAENQIPKPTQ